MQNYITGSFVRLDGIGGILDDTREIICRMEDL
jgi:hypothetical protein